jgi:endonuclease/exonuclease/phosphatase (EEP) superfamily protein YafD
MKLISLNIWGSGSKRVVALEKPLLEFVKAQGATVDIFCFQEVWSGNPGFSIKTNGRSYHAWYSSLDDLKAVLPGFSFIFHPNFAEVCDLAMFFRDGIKTIVSGDVYVYGTPGFMPEDDHGHTSRNLQFLTIETQKGKRTIMNFHGLWKHKAGKTDLPERLEQSKKIVRFAHTLDHPYLIAGDFNLTLDSESVRILEEAPMRNLIREHGITDTRTHYYDEDERFADYIFTSEGIKVNDFRVMPEQVSDHAPLFIDFD